LLFVDQKNGSVGLEIDPIRALDDFQPFDGDVFFVG